MLKELNYDEAIAKMKSLSKKSKYVSVFVDGGWDRANNPYSITIITDGNGQKPHASISKETLKKLRDNGILGGNCLITYKARKDYPFLNGDKDESKLGDKLYRQSPFPLSEIKEKSRK